MTAFDLAWAIVKNRAHESATEDHAREGGRDDYDDGVSLEEGMKSWDHDPKLLAAYKSGYNFASKGVKKADGTVTSGTPGTNNPMHSRPPGYESGGILDPNRVKKPRIGSKKRSKKVKKNSKKGPKKVQKAPKKVKRKVKKGQNGKTRSK